MPSWPSLPDPLLTSFKETAPQTTIRTQMDQGPAKVRRRTTAGVRNVSFAMLLTTSQVATLDSFFTSDAAGGALSFTFTDPRTSVVQTARFANPPEYSSVSPGYFNAAISLEYLP